MMLRRLLALSTVALFTAAGSATAASAVQAREPLRLLGRTDLPGYRGDFDHLAADVPDHKVFMAAEDEGTVEVFDLDTGRHINTLRTFDTPHGLFLIPGTHQLIVTDSGKGHTRIIDTRTYRVLGHIPLAPGADSSYYDPSSRRLYIVTGGGDVGMKVCYLNEIDPWTRRVYRKLEFASDHVEALRAEQHGGRIFINVADRNEVDVIDKRSFKVIARWPLRGAKTNLSMALDEADRRLFVVTRNPTRMFVLDTANGRTVAEMGVPAVADGAFFDATRKRIYIPGAIGEIGVYQELDPDHYRELARVPSAIGAKSGLFVPALSELFVAASPGKRVGGAMLWYAAPPPAGRH